MLARRLQRLHYFPTGILAACEHVGRFDGMKEPTSTVAQVGGCRTAEYVDDYGIPNIPPEA